MGRKNTFGGNASKKKKRLAPKKIIADELDTSPNVKQMFGQIIAIYNGAHYCVLGTDNKQYLGRTNKKMKTRDNLPNGLYVVISLREYESVKKTCDIIAFANPPNDIKEHFKINNPVKYDDIVFCNDENELEEHDKEGFIKINNNKNSLNFDDINNDVLPVANNFMHETDSDDDSDSDYDGLPTYEMDKFGNYIMDKHEDIEKEKINTPIQKMKKIGVADSIARKHDVNDKVVLVENQIDDSKNYNFDDI